MMHLSPAEAEGFYAVHRERRSSATWDLHDFRPGAGAGAGGRGRDREEPRTDGATDPKKAARGTIRADLADSIDANAVHGSDGAQTARTEIAYFFPAGEVFSR